MEHFNNYMDQLESLNITLKKKLVTRDGLVIDYIEYHSNDLYPVNVMCLDSYNEDYTIRLNQLSRLALNEIINTSSESTARRISKILSDEARRLKGILNKAIEYYKATLTNRVSDLPDRFLEIQILDTFRCNIRTTSSDIEFAKKLTTVIVEKADSMLRLLMKILSHNEMLYLKTRKPIDSVTDKFIADKIAYLQESIVRED